MKRVSGASVSLYSKRNRIACRIDKILLSLHEYE